MSLANEATTDSTRKDDLAVMAAMTLLASDDPWTIETVADALGRDVDWLQAELDRNTAEDVPDGRPN